MGGRVVLSAEDNAANRRIVRDLLTKSGYTVIEATNGIEAVAMAERERPDLILMDLQLPRLSGYEATRAIRSSPALARTPIIAVTSYALSGDDLKAYDAGCTDYLAKPFHPKMLLEMVAKYLD